MTPEEFRARIERLGHTQSSLGRLLAEASGASHDTTRRMVVRMATGHARVSSEMCALLDALDELSRRAA